MIPGVVALCTLGVGGLLALLDRTRVYSLGYRARDVRGGVQIEQVVVDLELLDHRRFPVDFNAEPAGAT